MYGKLLREPGKVADAVVVAVAERLDVHLVDDRVLVPERIAARSRTASPACAGARAVC